jgi:hypothetical protein
MRAWEERAGRESVERLAIRGEESERRREPGRQWRTERRRRERRASS